MSPDIMWFPDMGTLVVELEENIEPHLSFFLLLLILALQYTTEPQTAGL